MTSSEVIQKITALRRHEHCVIKSWGAGHTFIDFDLIDRFIGTLDHKGAIEGFELLDIEQIWQVLIELDPDKLVRVNGPQGEVIEWLWRDSDGREKKNVYPFTPEGIMTIIDDEFFA